MKWIFTLAFFLTVQVMMAQDYRMAVGVRSGFSSGFSLKYFPEPELGLEGLMSFRNYGVQMTGMVQHYRPIDYKASGLWYWFYGYGFHTGFYTRPYTRSRPDHIEDERFFRPALGGDFILGTQLNLQSIPLTFGAEFKPYIDVFGVRFMHFRFWDVGFSVRYNFD